ncbi:hypothetical protein ACE83Q_04870 [Dellaglioa sp. P0083]|uniref:hypothetical protein n=1 Tax=Dellaglioa kimchii TaxID=3344667 RepID=UPI0038D36232
MRAEFQKQHTETYQVDNHKGLNGWISFFLSLSLIVLFVTSVLKITVLNQTYTEDKILTDSNVTLVTRQMNDGISNIATLNDVPTSAVKDALTNQQVTDIAKNSLSNVYAGKQTVINPTEITNQVASNVMKKADTSNPLVSAKIDEIVATFKSNLSEYLTNNVQTPYLSKVSSTVSSVKSTVQTAFMYSLIASIIFALLLLVINRAFFIPLKYVGFSAIWSGILVAIGSAVALYSGLIGIVSSKASVFTDIVNNYISDTFNTMLVGSLILLAVGLVFWLIGRNKK